MSSTAESLKQGATESALDEPTSKKAKVTTNDASDQIKPDNADNGTTAKGVSDSIGVSGGTSTKTSTNNNNNNDVNNKTIPNKSVTGLQQHDKESNPGGPASESLDDDDDDDEMISFDPNIAKKLEQVEQIQTEICNLNEKASEEILKVEQKFNTLRRPHFEKRNDLLKEIPNFWLTSLANHPIIAPMIESAEDEDCLHYMINLDVEEFEDIKSGYKLKLHFVENPYIKNQVITKEFQVVNGEEVICASTLAQPIEFKETTQGQKLKRIVEDSIAASKRSTRSPGQTQQSFFAWLSEPSESGTDDVAEILKDQIWPNPLEFFFAAPDDYEAGTDDDSDDEDEEIDDEDLDDDIDDQQIGLDLDENVEIYDDDLGVGEDNDDDDDDDDDDEEDDEELSSHCLDSDNDE